MNRKSFHLPSAAPSRDVGTEIETHLALRAAEFEAAGMSAEDARRAALESFGDRAAIESEVTSLRATTLRARYRRDWIADMLTDIRVGARALRRAPGFAIVAILTIAIGIGANTAIFSVLRSVLLRPLPYTHPEQLVQVWADHRALGRKEPEWLTPPDFLDWQHDNTTFTSMASYQGWLPDLTGTGDPESLAGAVVSGNYFDLLGARPAAGRLLAVSDDDPGAEPVVVLSNALWKRRFGGDSAVLQHPITLNGVSWTVVGVLPASFRPPLPATADVFRATRRPANAPCGRGCIVIRSIGRLKPGVTLGQAQADLARIAARIATEYPQTNEKVGAWLVPLQEQIAGRARQPLIALTGAVALVLIIGCVNLANLLLARGASRVRELTVRSALGAGRWRIARQLLTENALLAALGGTLGLVLGIVGSRMLATLVPVQLRQIQEIRVDGEVLLFTAALTLLAGAVFGLAPALAPMRAASMETLRTGSRDTGRRGNLVRRALAVAQLSLAVVLLVGAGLLLRSFLQMEAVDIGFRTDRALLTSVAFPPSRYDNPRVLVVVEDLLAKLRANPAIRAAEVTDLPPLIPGDQDITAIPVGEPERGDLPPSIWYRSVSAGYLTTMRMKLVAGRTFTSADHQGGTPVGIVNEEAARRFWPGKDPVGRELATGRSPAAPKIRVIGVVASARHDGPSQPYKTELFLPLSQFPARRVTVVIDPARDANTAIAAFRDAIRQVDPLVPVGNIQSMEQLAGEAVALPRLYALLVGVFASVALLLAVLGVYGVIAYAVTQRQREIGVRLALGAAPASIERMVLGEGGRLAVAGVVIGVMAALALGRVLSTLLFGITAFDLPTFASAAAILGAMTIFASWLPARRAMRVDPLLAMRTD